ncbi:unnamed protein product [Parnassius apollo]|uniref:(apollo) hypothetical protein n=1 Tax=Parnassius apollo TaxID=110799 RepID=A0A8S3WU82_PARAO|nr:unnamed protein product [Parnassius apollo]
MDLLNENERRCILNHYGASIVIEWKLEDFSNNLMGAFGEHLRLIIILDVEGVETELKLFLKCMPRNNQRKAEYIKELTFFRKEYVMLNQLFKHFQDGEGLNKWRPKLLYIREDLFVFEDATQIGYKVLDHRCTMSYDELSAVVNTLAKFHAQSIIYEEKKSRELKITYRIWDEYSEYLTEPEKGHSWRDTGKRAVIDFLRIYSKHKTKIDFMKHVEDVISRLFSCALNLMKPSSEFRNVVIHRDLWTNNIFFKQLGNGQYHSLIVDFQTVLYCPPMHDLCSLIYFNTSRSFREANTDKIINLYYSILTEELKSEGIDVINIMDKKMILKSYRQSIVFGITQAALIVPIIAMNDEMRILIFEDPDNFDKVNFISRSEEFINVAKDDNNYRNRIIELFDEIIEIFYK